MKLPYKMGQVRITSPYGNRVLNGAPDWHSGDKIHDIESVICGDL